MRFEVTVNSYYRILCNSEYSLQKVRELRRLRTSLKIAINVGLSRKGPWRLARTLATQTGMTNQWFKDQK